MNYSVSEPMEMVLSSCEGRGPLKESPKVPPHPFVALATVAGENSLLATVLLKVRGCTR